MFFNELLFSVSSLIFFRTIDSVNLILLSIKTHDKCSKNVQSLMSIDNYIYII